MTSSTKWNCQGWEWSYKVILRYLSKIHGKKKVCLWMLPTAWWCRNNLLFTYYMGSSLHEQLHSNLKLAQLWTQRWMFHSEVDVGNKLSTQTPSSAHWMGTRSHLRMTFTCVVAIYISDASSYNCCYNDHGIYLRLMNRQNYFLVFWARTGSTLLSMKSKHFSQGVRGISR